MNFLIEIASFLAGLIDSVVGGGGLITVPVFIESLGPSPVAIGTNKVPALAAQMIAAWVYLASQRPSFRWATFCLLLSATGAVAGAHIAPLMPQWFFNAIPLVVSPLILVLVLSRSAWAQRPTQEINENSQNEPRVRWVATGIGVLCAGFYDGIAGPGGGTLMFIALFFLGGLPPVLAMGLGKVANLGSAASSFASYAHLGAIDWNTGLRAVAPILIGAWLGAKLIVSQEKAAGAERVRSIARVSLGIISLGIAIRFGLNLIWR